MITVQRLEARGANPIFNIYGPQPTGLSDVLPIVALLMTVAMVFIFMLWKLK